jgi:hypothetical protein
VIDVPRSLDKKQKAAIDELAGVMDESPRDRLFTGAGEKEA